MNDGDEIVALARSIIGVPYRHMGRDTTGMDCLGVVLRVAELRGYELPVVGEYSRNPSGKRMARLLCKHAIQIRPNMARSGDFLHMAFGRHPQHLAIISSDDPTRIIHADSEVGRVVEHTLSDGWIDRVRGAYRFPDLT